MSALQRSADGQMPVKLQIQGVRKEYISPRTGEMVNALEPVDLALGQGEFLSIVGPSGCGKSTLLKIVAGIDQATEGHVLLDGKPTEGPGPDRALVFQQYVLFPWKTVWENVEFGLRAAGMAKPERDAVVRRWLDTVGLSGFTTRFPHELSGGMQQRCALARALALDPRVLLMDEPLAAIDAQTRVILQEELLTVWGQERPPSERKSVVYVTHAIDEAVFLSDRVVVMSARPGRIKAVINIDLPRPRRFETRATEGYARLVQRIWQEIAGELGASLRSGTSLTQ